MHSCCFPSPKHLAPPCSPSANPLGCSAQVSNGRDFQSKKSAVDECDHLQVFPLFKVQFNLKIASPPLNKMKTLEYFVLVFTVLTFLFLKPKNFLIGN